MTKIGSNNKKMRFSVLLIKKIIIFILLHDLIFCLIEVIAFFYIDLPLENFRLNSENHTEQNKL